MLWGQSDAWSLVSFAGSTAADKPVMEDGWKPSPGAAFGV